MVELVDKAMSEFSIASAPGASYADVFPIRALSTLIITIYWFSCITSHPSSCLVPWCRVEEKGAEMARRFRGYAQRTLPIS